MRLRKKVRISENDPDYRIKNYLNTVKPHRAVFGMREDDMWTIISSVQKYYHEKTELLRAEYEGRLKALGIESEESDAE